MIEIGGELAQPTVNIIGTQPRRVRATEPRRRRPGKLEVKLLGGRGFVVRSELKGRKDRSNTVDMRPPGTTSKI